MNIYCGKEKYDKTYISFFYRDIQKNLRIYLIFTQICIFIYARRKPWDRLLPIRGSRNISRSFMPQTLVAVRGSDLTQTLGLIIYVSRSLLSNTKQA